MVEMMRLAKELRQIRRDGIDEKANLAAAVLALQQRAVIAERPESQSAQAPGKAGVGHIPFMRGKDDAAALVDDFDNCAEIVCREGKLKTAGRS
jgi:hypothetical protein